MSEPVKILEISDKDWLSGISAQPYIPVGGLFQQSTNFDPFDKIGIYVPSQSESSIGVGVVATDIRWIVSFSSTAVSGVTYFHAFGNSTLYTGRTTQGALPGGGSGFIENQSSRITNMNSRGAIQFKSKIVYFGQTNAIANSLPIPRVSAEVTILSNLTDSYAHIPHIGPDRNLYVTNGSKIARVTSVTGTSGNDASFLSFEEDIATRGIADDGKHLIIVGDSSGFNEPNAGLATGEIRCFVAFWNMKSQDLTRIWEFKDNHVFGVEIVEDDVVVFARNNVYVCSVDSKPRILLLKGGNSNVQESTPEPGSIKKINDHMVIWGGEGYSDGDNNKNTIFGYGRVHPSLPKSLFTKHTLSVSPSGTKSIFSLFYDGGNTNKIIASYGNSMYIFSGTNQTSTTKIAGMDFKKPYEFSFAKVVLNKKLSSGQSVDVEIKTDEGDNTVLRNSSGTTNSFSHTNFPGKKSHIFYPTPGTQATSTIALFEDLSDITIKNVGAEIRRFELWGKPLRPDQDVYK